MRRRKKKGKGNRHKQWLRRKERMMQRPPKQKSRYRLIDGNVSRYPVAICEYHGGYLSSGLMETHRCRERKCARLKPMPGAEREKGKEEKTERAAEKNEEEET